MAYTLIATFNAYNGSGYDAITVSVDFDNNDVIASGNTLSTYPYSDIYDYVAQGVILTSYTNPIDGLDYNIYGGNDPIVPGVMQSPFAYTALTTAGCDLIFLSILTDDETIALNDGKITATASSSYSGVEFSIDNITFGPSGVFTGLAPGTYTVYVKDSHGCTQSQDVVILPNGGGPAIYGERYYLEYSSTQNDSNVFRISLKQKGWTGATTRLTPGSQPCVKRYSDNNEDKYSTIIGSSLDINIINDGTFIMSTFYSNDERQFKVEQTLNGTLKWQGWLIPDEIKDFYTDTNYEIALTATDGLESLKGFDYIDADNVAILGKKKMTEILQFCLASDLDAGSLYQYNQTYLWSDSLYDQDLNPKDCYQGISDICQSFGLSLKQVDGNFIFSLANDLNKTTGNRIVTEYDIDFNFIGDSGTYPSHKSIGILGDYIPVNPAQDIRYDKPLPKVSVTHDFTAFSIYNTNRSFENGAVVDGQPPGWTVDNVGTNYSVFGLKNVSYAYAGTWVYRVNGNIDISGGPSLFSTSIAPPIIIDRTGLKFSMAIAWLAVSPSDQDPPRGAIEFKFTRTSDAAVYYLRNDGAWVPAPATPSSEGNLQTQYKNEWNNFQTADFSTSPDGYTGEIPGIGVIQITFLPAQAYKNGDPINGEGDPDAADAYIDYDDYEITLSSYSFNNNDLTGETWNIINKTKVFLGQSRDLTNIYYDQPNNTFLNGNIFFFDGSNYIVTNKWYAIGQPYDQASIGKILPIEILANYQRPAIIWEGDILSDDATMGMVFTINGYPGMLFMPISFEHDERKGTIHLVLEEIIDDTIIFDFQYVPKYSRNSRTTIS